MTHKYPKMVFHIELIVKTVGFPKNQSYSEFYNFAGAESINFHPHSFTSSIFQSGMSLWRTSLDDLVETQGDPLVFAYLGTLSHEISRVLRGNQIRRSSVAYSNIFQLLGGRHNRNLNHRQSPTHSASISNYCGSFPGSSIEAAEKRQGSHVEMSSDIGKAITDQNWIANKIPKTFRRPQWFGHKATMENQ
jgi:hypothetical protein